MVAFPMFPFIQSQAIRDIRRMLADDKSNQSQFSAPQSLGETAISTTADTAMASVVTPIRNPLDRPAARHTAAPRTKSTATIGRSNGRARPRRDIQSSMYHGSER